jgi:cytosine permease
MSDARSPGRRRDEETRLPSAAASSGEYEFAPVPEGQGSSGIQIALIIIGGTIGFSILVMAAEIGGSLGLAQAALAFTLGSLVLGIMGATTSYVGARSRPSAYLLTTFAFGRLSAKVANVVVAASLIGWYGVISSTMGAATQRMLLDQLGVEVSLYAAVTAVSALMIIIAGDRQLHRRRDHPAGL